MLSRWTFHITYFALTCLLTIYLSRTITPDHNFALACFLSLSAAIMFFTDYEDEGTTLPPLVTFNRKREARRAFGMKEKVERVLKFEDKTGERSGRERVEKNAPSKSVAEGNLDWNRHKSAEGHADADGKSIERSSDVEKSGERRGKNGEGKLVVTESLGGVTSEFDPNERVLRDLKRFYDEDRPYEAVNEWTRLQAEKRFGKQDVTSKAAKDLIRKIEEAHNEIFRLTTVMMNKDNWNFKSKHRGCDIYASTIDPRDFKVVAACPDSDVFNLISLVYETDLYKKWVPGCTESARWLHNTFRQTLYLKFKVPFPFQDRDLLLKGYGDVWESNTVMIYIQSVEDKEAEAHMGVKPGATRAEVLFAGLEIKPTSERGGVQLTMMTRLDLKLSMVPDSLFDYIAKFIVAELCIYLRDRSKAMAGKDKHTKTHRPWLERQTNPSSRVYREVEDRLSKLQEQYQE